MYIDSVCMYLRTILAGLISDFKVMYVYNLQNVCGYINMLLATLYLYVFSSI